MRRNSNSGDMYREPQDGIARFTLICRRCKSEQAASVLKVGWQCHGCGTAHTIETASYVPASTYYANHRRS
jgi:ribosomal protein L37AE/L43A